MAIARSNVAFIGTAEGSGASISNNATSTGSEIDMLGDNTSAGEVELYAQIVSTVTAGTIDIYVDKQRVTGASYAKSSPNWSIPPTNGTQNLPLGRVGVERYMKVRATNNATGASATVFIGGTLFKIS